MHSQYNPNYRNEMYTCSYKLIHTILKNTFHINKWNTYKLCLCQIFNINGLTIARRLSSFGCPSFTFSSLFYPIYPNLPLRLINLYNLNWTNYGSYPFNHSKKSPKISTNPKITFESLRILSHPKFMKLISKLKSLIPLHPQLTKFSHIWELFTKSSLLEFISYFI